MSVIKGDNDNLLAATYQLIEMARLNESLKECGISDMAVRRRVVEHYFFDSGYFLDGCWFAHKECRYRPGIYFRPLDDRNKPIDTVILPNPSTGTWFHEVAHGASMDLYEDYGETLSDIETGDATGA